MVDAAEVLLQVDELWPFRFQLVLCAPVESLELQRQGRPIMRCFIYDSEAFRQGLRTNGRSRPCINTGLQPFEMKEKINFFLFIFLLNVSPTVIIYDTLTFNSRLFKRLGTRFQSPRLQWPKRGDLHILCSSSRPIMIAFHSLVT